MCKNVRSLVLSYVLIYLSGISTFLIYTRICNRRDAERAATKEALIIHSTSICALMPILCALSNCDSASVKDSVCNMIDTHIILLDGMRPEGDVEFMDIAHDTGKLVHRWHDSISVSTNGLHRMTHNKASRILNKWNQDAKCP